jgi:LPS sulfotransferase NodH
MCDFAGKNCQFPHFESASYCESSQLLFYSLRIAVLYMKKYFIMTRGRTGSSAIIDELNNVAHIRSPSLEPFLRIDFEEFIKKQPEVLDQIEIMMPFDLWSNKFWVKFVAKYFLEDRRLIQQYLKHQESLASREGSQAFGFKVLSHHFDETPQLSEVLLDRKYSALYLTRNSARQVISGMIAKKRGIYNTKKEYKSNVKWKLDADEFKYLVKVEEDAKKSDIYFLSNSEFDFIEISYEKFLENRSEFFRGIFDFLDLPLELPRPSTYSVMIENIKGTIENYQDIAECAADIGVPLE